MIQGLGKITGAIVDFVYPPVCATCERSLRNGEAFICSRCWGSFERVARTETITQLIEEKFLADEALDGIDSVFLFEQDARVRETVHLLKYAGAEIIARKFGMYIAKKIVGDSKLSVCDMIVPVPLHAARRRERGYNQSELISDSVGGILRMTHTPDLLVRLRQTKTQTSFDADGRKKNVQGAFGIGKRRIGAAEGRTILLIDDVITTGATIKECARTLKSNGAREVYAVSAAIAV